MSEEISLKKSSLRLLYYRYKDSSYYYTAIISLIIIACIILFFQIVVPQFQNWFSIRNEVIATRSRVDTINKNINLMNNIDRPLLNSQVDVATSALPFDKNFGAIVGALSDASLKAGVALNDFTFQVGNIASVSGQTTGAKKSFSSVQLMISVDGDVVGIQRFIKALEEKLPLSEITNVDGDAKSTTITIDFYQKQFPHIVYKDDNPLPTLSDKELALLQQLSGWQSVIQQQEGGTATSSAVPLF